MTRDEQKCLLEVLYEKGPRANSMSTEPQTIEMLVADSLCWQTKPYLEKDEHALCDPVLSMTRKL
jgi:hypothetical protein